MKNKAKKLQKYFELIISHINYVLENGFLKQLNTVYTHINYHLGDNLIHVNYIKRAARKNPKIKFIHYAKKSYIKDLKLCIGKMENVQILPLRKRPFFSVDSWKNYGGYWGQHPHKNDFVKFHLNFFEILSKKLDIENPIQCRNDLIFESDVFVENLKKYENYDILIVNSKPLSGQFIYEEQEFNRLILSLAHKFKLITTQKVKNLPCTTDYQMSVHDIGTLSLSCKYHLMISTGPSWVVLNDYNLNNSKGIFLLLQNEYIDFEEKIIVINDLNQFDINKFDQRDG